jgi:anti-sigma regulatory factor (Ser/Thr protein kinase)/nucleoid DNA-binding protein
VEAIAKKELVEELKSKLGVPLQQGDRLVDALVEAIKDKLLKGHQVVLKDFAAIKVTEKKAQIVKDPETGHQYISPAENVVSFVPIDSFQRAIESAKLSSILLAVPSNDPFARVIEFHFSRVGWKVHFANTRAECLKALGSSGAYLTIVDHALKESAELIEDIKCTKASSMVPLIALYPAEKDPERCQDFMVLGDEHLVEPFEVYTLLMLAESELARSSEEEVIFDQQVNFQFGTREENIERANTLGARLFGASGLDEEGQVAMSAAFREAVMNAGSHGNKDDAKKLIKVLYLLDKEKITVVVQDEGDGFDHDSYTVRAQTKDAVAAARERHEQGRVGGLGIKLMMRCTDRLEYNDVGNMITLTKLLKPSGKPAEDAPSA